MKKSIKKKGLSWFIFCLLLLLIFIVIINSRINKIESHYNYTGPGGTFNFSIENIDENERHVLTYNYYKSRGLVRDKKVAIIPFRYSPMELEDIPMEDVRFMLLNSEVVYLARDYELDEFTDQKDGVAMLTLARILDNEHSPDIFEIPSIFAITSPVEGINSPVVGCSYSNIEARVIELRKGLENRIYIEDECVIMEFVEPDDSIKVATKLTYHILGVM